MRMWVGVMFGNAAIPDFLIDVGSVGKTLSYTESDTFFSPDGSTWQESRKALIYGIRRFMILG